MPFDKNKYREQSTCQVNIEFLKNDSLFCGLEKACSDTHLPRTKYLKTALAEKLQRDGYISEDEPIIIHGVGRRATPNK